MDAAGTESAAQLQHQILEIENPAAEQQPNQYRDQWRYLKFILVIVKVSLSSLGITFQAKGSLLPIEVGIILVTVFPILLLLCYLQIVEERTPINVVAREAPASSRLLLFIISLCLIFIIFAFTWVNAVLIRKDGTS